MDFNALVGGLEEGKSESLDEFGHLSVILEIAGDKPVRRAVIPSQADVSSD